MSTTKSPPPNTLDLRPLKSVVREKWPHGPVRDFCERLPDRMDRHDALVRLEALLDVIRSMSGPV